MKRLRVVGLDLSLTSTGMSDGQTHHAVQTSTDACLEARLDLIVQTAMDFVFWAPAQRHQWTADLVVIEGASYGSKGSGVEQLSALRLMVRHRLWRRRIPFALVAPSTLKAYTTGNGHASKQEMVSAVDARYRAHLADVKVKDGRYDRADALALAAMGYDHVGQALPSYVVNSDPHRDSLASVKWPGLVSDD